MWNYAGKSDSGKYSGLSDEGWLHNNKNDIPEIFLSFSPCPSRGWHSVRTLYLSWNIGKAWNSSKYFCQKDSDPKLETGNAFLETS